MKRIRNLAFQLSLVLGVATMTLRASPAVPVRDTALVFRSIDYEDVFEVAAREGKSVFLYFHFDGCGACVTMEKTTLKDPSVFEFMNANFVNLEVNTLREPGIGINKIWQVRMHPTFLFLDNEGDVLHKIVGVFDIPEFMEHARQAVSGETTYARMSAEYANGRRDPDFLYQYCYILRDAFLLTPPVIGEYLATQSGTDLGSEKNLLFIYEFALHQFEVAIPFGSPAYEYMYHHQDAFSTYYPKVQVETRLAWIAQRAAGEAMQAGDEETFRDALDVLRSLPSGKPFLYNEVDGRTTGAIMETDLVARLEMEHARHVGDSRLYRSLARDYIESKWDDADALNELAWEYYLHHDDPDELQEALRWSRRSIDLKDIYMFNDTYAALLFKTGHYKQARKYAERAIGQAGQTGQDAAETVALLLKIQEALKK